MSEHLWKLSDCRCLLQPVRAEGMAFAETVAGQLLAEVGDKLFIHALHYMQ